MDSEACGEGATRPADRRRPVRIQRPTPETFAAHAEGWADRHADANGLKPSTRQAYRLIVDGHLIPALGGTRLGAIDLLAVDEYVARKRGDGLSARTIHRHLVCLGLILRKAQQVGKIARNPVPLVDRPRDGGRRRRWRILRPEEVASVEQAFCALIGEAETRSERAWREQARVLFLVAMDTGMRRGELLGLRWSRVHLADPEGPRLEVVETWTRSRVDTPKSEASERTISLNTPIDSELFGHRGRSPYPGEDERVFCSSRGTPLDVHRYAETFRLALAKAGIVEDVRPFHDMRHSWLTNGAAAKVHRNALQKRAGHSSYATTQLYVDLAGVEFGDEDAKLGARLWGTSKASGTNSRYKVEVVDAVPESEAA
jgi:integrase